MGEIKFGFIYEWNPHSVLMGIIFKIYINDLCDGNFRCWVTTLADDMSLFYKGDSFLEL